MGQPSKKNQSALLSTVGSFFECIIFIVILVALQIPMIYLAGSDSAHTADPHPLDQAFSTEDHQAMLKKLTKDSDRYFIVEGQENSGLIAFIKHYASIEKNRRLVLMRQYGQDPLETAYVIFRFAKTLVEDQLDLEQNRPKIWILLGFEKKVPHQDVFEIQKNYPRDKIIVVTNEKAKIKGFKTLHFPSVTVDDLEKVMQQELGTSQEIADVLTHHYQTVPEIFCNLNTANYSNQLHLGDDYKSLESLSEVDEKVIQELCEKGKAKGSELSKQLNDVGVILHKGTYYWASEQVRLNYELQTISKCKHTQASEEILNEFYEEEEKHANSQTDDDFVEGNDQEANQDGEEQQAGSEENDQETQELGQEEDQQAEQQQDQQAEQEDQEAVGEQQEQEQGQEQQEEEVEGEEVDEQDQIEEGQEQVSGQEEQEEQVDEEQQEGDIEEQEEQDEQQEIAQDQEQDEGQQEVVEDQQEGEEEVDEQEGEEEAEQQQAEQYYEEEQQEEVAEDEDEVIEEEEVQQAQQEIEEEQYQEQEEQEEQEEKKSKKKDKKKDKKKNKMKNKKNAKYEEPEQLQEQQQQYYEEEEEEKPKKSKKDKKNKKDKKDKKEKKKNKRYEDDQQ